MILFGVVYIIKCIVKEQYVHINISLQYTLLNCTCEQRILLALIQYYPVILGGVEQPW